MAEDNVVTTTYTGGPIVGTIEDGTNPWIEVDGKAIDWTARRHLQVPCPCGENGNVFLPGVLDGMDTPEGVQRCDACDTYPGDLDAALALAKAVGGVVKFRNDKEV